MYQSVSAPWLWFRAWNTDGSAKTDLVFSTSGIDLKVARDNLANSSSLSLSAASSPTDWAAGKLNQVVGNLYRVGISTALISSYTGNIAVCGSYTGGTLEGIVDYVSAYDPTGNPNTIAPATPASVSDLQDTVDSIATAFSGSSPVEPTGVGVFELLEHIQDSIDTYIASVTAVDGSSGTIVGFPATLTIGNSYTTEGGNAIHVFIRDENDDPITSVGTHNFTDPDFSCDLIITNSGNAGRVRATVTYVDPGAAESYLKVEIPLSESSRAAAGAATMQCTLKWDGVAKTIATQTVTWVARI